MASVITSSFLFLSLQEGLAPLNLFVEDEMHRATPGRMKCSCILLVVHAYIFVLKGQHHLHSCHKGYNFSWDYKKKL